MTSLRDIMETSNVSIKQIQDHYKKSILNEVESIKSRKRNMPLAAISKELGVSESTITRYRKDLNCANHRRQLTTTQKYAAQLNMQLGKAKAKYSRDEYSEDEYKKKVSEIENKFATLSIKDPLTTNHHSDEVQMASIKVSKRGNLRGGALDTEDSDDGVTKAGHDYDIKKLMNNAASQLPASQLQK